MSDGGVKIIAEYPEIPSEFTVIFSEGTAAPVPAGLADRLRTRRAIRRLGRAELRRYERLGQRRSRRPSRRIDGARERSPITAKAGELNLNLGLSCECFWTVAAVSPATCSRSCSIRPAFARLLACTSTPDPGVGAWRLPDLGTVRHHRLDRREGRHQPRRRSAARRRALPGTLSRQSEGRRRRAEIRQGAARRRDSGRRRLRCSNRPPSPIPATRRCSPAMAARWPTTAISSRRSTCSAAPIAPTIPIGGCSRRRERRWINSAGMRRRGNIMRAR